MYIDTPRLAFLCCPLFRHQELALNHWRDQACVSRARAADGRSDEQHAAKSGTHYARTLAGGVNFASERSLAVGQSHKVLTCSSGIRHSYSQEPGTPDAIEGCRGSREPRRRMRNATKAGAQGSLVVRAPHETRPGTKAPRTHVPSAVCLLLLANIFKCDIKCDPWTRIAPI